MNDRLTRCRYRRRNDDMCTGEAVDPNGDVLLCQKHLSRAITLMRTGALQKLARQQPAIRKPDPSENCYCGGPEEIYPHRHGTGYYCRRKRT